MNANSEEQSPNNNLPPKNLTYETLDNFTKGWLFAYAILRAIPNKLGGVIALVLSIAILFILPFSNNFKFQRTQFYPINQIIF